MLEPARVDATTKTLRAHSSFRTPSVLHIASGDLWGGAEAVVAELAREQHAASPGQVACVVMNPGILADELTRSGIRTLVLDESRMNPFQLATQTARLVRELRPDILHAHRQKENLIALLAKWLRGAGVPRPRLVSTIHGLPEPVAAKRSWRRRMVANINERILRAGFDAIVAVSRDIERTFRARFPDERVVCVHNGIRVPEAAMRAGADTTRPLKLLALGRLVPIKRYDRLREIGDGIAAAGRRAQIRLAGDGPLQRELEHLLRPSDPASGFEMPGFVRDVAPLLEECDALLITSDHEGIPMSALEALARGIPVFGFRVGGLPELETEGAPVRLVDPGDSAALARTIVSYFSEFGAGHRIYPSADWPFGIRQCARAYQQLYESLSATRAAQG
jgi:glycosyltransferase involved in cell wall biosynthesis